jgi:hypothetical protein
MASANTVGGSLNTATAVMYLKLIPIGGIAKVALSNS